MKKIKFSAIALSTLIFCYGCGAKQKEVSKDSAALATSILVDSTLKTKAVKDSTKELVAEKIVPKEEISTQKEKKDDKKKELKKQSEDKKAVKPKDINKKKDVEGEKSKSIEKNELQSTTNKEGKISKTPKKKATKAVKPGKLDFHAFSSKFPSSVKVTGKVVGGKKWADRNGENTLILTESGAYESDTQGKDAELHIYLYRGSNEKDSTLQQVWHIHDYVSRCEFETVCSHIKNSLSVTDLDNDKQAELTFMYRIGCKGGQNASPQNKLIMQEGAQRHQFQASVNAIVEAGDDEILFDSWTDMSAVLREFAEAKWRRIAN